LSRALALPAEHLDRKPPRVVFVPGWTALLSSVAPARLGGASAWLG